MTNFIVSQTFSFPSHIYILYISWSASRLLSGEGKTKPRAFFYRLWVGWCLTSLHFWIELAEMGQVITGSFIQHLSIKQGAWEKFSAKQKLIWSTEEEKRKKLMSNIRAWRRWWRTVSPFPSLINYHWGSGRWGRANLSMGKVIAHCAAHVLNAECCEDHGNDLIGTI